MANFNFNSAKTLTLGEFMHSNNYSTIECGINKNGKLFLIIDKNKSTQRFLNCSKELSEADLKSGNFNVSVDIATEDGEAFDMAIKKAESKLVSIAF